MFVPSSFGLAFALCVTSSICWGSWSNTCKAVKCPFSLYYIDFSLACFVVSIVAAVILGESFVGTDGVSALSKLGPTVQHEPVNIFYAAAAGAIFNVANLLLVVSIELVGLAVTFPVAIGTALVTGTILTYVVQPTGDPVLLFIGVAVALVAVTCDGLAHRELTRHRGQQHLQQQQRRQQGDAHDDDDDDDTKAYHDLKGTKEYSATSRLVNDGDQGTRSSSRSSNSSSGGGVNKRDILICLIAGILMGSWSPLSTKSMQGDYPLVPYSSFAVYCAGALVTTPALVTWLMKYPVTGPQASWRDYLGQVSMPDHGWAWLGGVIWAIGTLFNMIAGNKLGFAISYAVGQTSPMVAALWGIFYFKETAGANRLTYIYFGLMFFLYCGAVTLVAISH